MDDETTRREETGRRDGKSASAFRTITEVAAELALPQHVLRFWETRFPQIKPLKRGGGRRYYRPEDMELLRGIRRLLHEDGYTIKGVQKLLRQNGAKGLDAMAAPVADAEPAAPAENDEDRRREAHALIAELEELRDILQRGAA
jgi:DNA-binding transcriptional MerR regulator